ncbi:patatin family protein [Nocardioides phosphati]|uniref:Patatin family protein n=1 Tax=Nocardioides phosphati TaxID=1867775 RepID=A0ABQ2NE47_9ACTN|nr:patatin-like phospholipase family protein [Nocardioides phosphati]GGO92853.1 patatin family protein [Nocardioides phosphati]
MSDLVDILRARRSGPGGPGARPDGHRVALAIEGGGNRAAYSAGMALALDELGLTGCFDAVYGTSGGALNAAWLLTGEAQKWLPSWGAPEVASAGVTNPRRLLRGGPLVDLSVLIEHVYEQITPMDFEAILANPVSFHPMATDAATGEAVDIHPCIVDRATLQTALKASSCLPMIAGRPVRLGGRAFVDGGLSEAIPYLTALRQGATHVLVLRTRREDQTVTTSRAERVLLAPYFAAFARGAGRSHGRRHLTYAAADAAQVGGEVLQVRPPLGSADVARLGGSLDLVTEAIEVGRRAVHALFG